MTATAQDPPKKAEKSELPPLKPPYETRVKFEQIDPKTGKVEWFADDVDALFKNDKWQLRSGTKHVKIKPIVGSRITDDKGQVWVVDAVSSTTALERYILTVTKQPAAKKDNKPK